MIRFLLLTSFVVIGCKHRVDANLSSQVSGDHDPSSMSYSTDINNKVNYTQDVIYQIRTDRFFTDKPNNPRWQACKTPSHDALKLYCGGNWAGITKKMKYIKSLGVSAIWVSPVVENTMQMGKWGESYHGYYAQNFKKPNPRFGSEKDFKKMVQAAHSLGLKVIIDFAPNHTNETDPFLGKFYDVDRGQTKLMGDVKTDDRNQYFNHYTAKWASKNGGCPARGEQIRANTNVQYKNLGALADLNHLNPKIDRYMKEAIHGWLDRGVDGIRVDAIIHMPFGWLRNWADSYNTHKPIFTFGEYFISPTNVYKDSPRLRNSKLFANESTMSIFDMEYAHALRRLFFKPQMIPGLYKACDAGPIGPSEFRQKAQTIDANYKHPIDLVTFLSSHDRQRLRSTTDQLGAELAYTILLGSRGVPVVYYGDENYMEGEGEDWDTRRQMVFPTQETRLMAIIKRMANLRKTNPALAYGHTKYLRVQEDTYVFEREFAGSIVLIAVNLNPDQPARFKVNTKLPINEKNPNVLANLWQEEASFTSTDGISLPPGSAAVWEYTNTRGQPTIGHVGPMEGKPGRVITIDGKFFGSSPDNVQLLGKGSKVQPQVISWKDNQIQVKIPHQATPGTYIVMVKGSQYSNFRILSGDLITMRFLVKGIGKNGPYFVRGTLPELGGNGQNEIHNMPMLQVGDDVIFNTTLSKDSVYQINSQDAFIDLSVPVSTNISFNIENASGRLLSNQRVKTPGPQENSVYDHIVVCDYQKRMNQACYIGQTKNAP